MKRFLYFFTLSVILCSCNGKERMQHTRSTYYWSTTLTLDNVKKQFLSEHNIDRLYVRYFDVVTDKSGQPMPNATIHFASKIPKDIEVVPTIYITNECMAHGISDLPEKILGRILQMNATNGIENVKEIQIDCDWTLRTQKSYFAFLNCLRHMARQKEICLSVTIRLHQLSQTPPPADRGVLMMYNTGDFTDIHCKRPILDMHDVTPYLKNISNYGLPLSTAYPIFQWKLLYRGGKYVGIIHHDEELPILPGDSIVERIPSLSDILNAKNAISEIRSDANDEIILFDINNNNILRFKQNEYEKIYNH